MSTEVIVAFIAAAAALIGAWGATWSNFLMQKANAKLQADITEKQIKNSFQLAAMDKRLEAHQKAFHIWTKMSSFVHAPYEVKDKVRDEAVEFWATHCLYLEPEANEQFRRCINNYYDYRTYLDTFRNLPRNTKESEDAYKVMQEVWNQIHDAYKYIVKGARFPYIDIEPTKENPTGEKKEETKKN